jgi:hypothetical protein
VTKILELAHLVQQHRVPKVQIGRRCIENGLDAQRAAKALSSLQILRLDDFVGAAADQVERCLHVRHETPCCCAEHTASRRLPRKDGNPPGKPGVPVNNSLVSDCSQVLVAIGIDAARARPLW